MSREVPILEVFNFTHCQMNKHEDNKFKHKML